jgi:hypothetical protein
MKNKIKRVLKNTKWVMVILATLVTRYGVSQSIEDFEKALALAERGAGCESIPYGNYKSQCETTQAIVDGCSQSNNPRFKCENMNPDAFLEQIKGMENKISSLQQENRSFESSKSSSSNDDEKRNLDDKIKSNSESIKRMEDEIKTKRDQLYKERQVLTDNISVGEKCVKARKDVQNIFAEAGKSAKNESDPTKKVIGEKLAKIWEDRGDDHQKAIDDWEKAVQNCKDWLSRNR